MNGIDKITQRIGQEAQSETDRIVTQGEAAAREIAQRYQRQAESLAAELAVRNQKAAAQQEERLVSVAQMEARKVTLAARQEMVEQAFQLAAEKLYTLPDDEYVAAVAGLLCRAAPDGRGAVIFAPGERETMGQAIVVKANAQLGGGELTLSEETRPIQGGFILVRGSVEVNGTFEMLIRLQRDQIAGETARRLFPGE